MVCLRRKLLLSLLILLVAAPSRVWAGSHPPSSQRFTILLSNDDGYNAPGLQALIRALAPVGRLFVAAPADDESGKGQSISVGMPIYAKLERHTDGGAFYAIRATPATCVRLALDALMPSKPDVVISGINRGANLGLVVYYSGTVGAAREAAFSGVPAIAVSLGSDNAKEYAAAAGYVRSLLEKLRAQDLLQPGLFLNVNVPAGHPKGVRVTRLSMRPGQMTYQRHTDARGRLFFLQGWEPPRNVAEGTDLEEFARGYITLTPMTLDATAPKSFGALGALETEPQAAPVAH